jgi:hypothetical protein
MHVNTFEFVELLLSDRVLDRLGFPLIGTNIVLGAVVQLL